jgi:hypothetical protein
MALMSFFSEIAAAVAAAVQEMPIFSDPLVLMSHYCLSVCSTVDSPLAGFSIFNHRRARFSVSESLLVCYYIVSLNQNSGEKTHNKQ